ncbi:FeoA family protein [Vibrio sp.]|uniref:FeoA family protein n=1 Tax=Vibrio sp. TaxID=678 RepID=UPI003D10A23F
MTLSELSPGQSAKITGFCNMAKETRKKLMIMGLLPDTPITLIRRAPMGDPLQIEARGVTLAVRNSIAKSIALEVIE